MHKTSKRTPIVDPARRQAVIYARVSSKEQEKEGFSIPAQLKLLKEYASAQRFAVTQEYVDVETAKQTGRAAFGEMVTYFKSHPAVRVLRTRSLAIETAAPLAVHADGEPFGTTPLILGISAQALRVRAPG